MTKRKHLYCACGPIIFVYSTRHEAVGKAAVFSRETGRDVTIMPLAVPEAVWEVMDQR